MCVVYRIARALLPIYGQLLVPTDLSPEAGKLAILRRLGTGR
jgi:hypothetical protein